MNGLKERLLNRSRKGMVSGAVMSVITAAIVIFIGIWVISQVINSITQTGWSTTANTTYANVQTTMWNSIQLLSVGLIVLAAAVILAYFGFRGKGQS